MKPLHLAELSWEAAAKVMALPDCVGLLPIGATEAHGPHLPLHTDVYLSLELCERVAEALWGERTGLILPPVAFAITNYAAGFPGTIGLSPQTAADLLRDIVDSLGRHGLASVALVNSHLEPAHVALLDSLASAPRTQPRLVFVNHCRKPWALELGEEFKSGDCHAGAYETSLLMASRFETHIGKHLADLPPVRAGLVAKMKAGARTFQEMGADRAYFGDPAAASAAQGDTLWRVLVRMWVETIRQQTPPLPGPSPRKEVS